MQSAALERKTTGGKGGRGPGRRRGLFPKRAVKREHGEKGRGGAISSKVPCGHPNTQQRGGMPARIERSYRGNPEKGREDFPT